MAESADATRLKICRWQQREGSTPSRPTNKPVFLLHKRTQVLFFVRGVKSIIKPSLYNYRQKGKNMKTIHELLVWFAKQKLSANLLLGGLGLFLLFGMCILLSTIFIRPEQQSPSITETYEGAESITFITWTPAPPTLTSTPKESQKRCI